MAVTVVVPYTPGQPARERAWEWVQARYRDRHPGYELVVATGPADPWCKARLVMPAVRDAADGIIVVADADVWTDNLAAAVEAVEAGYAWAIPHRRVYRLTDDATAAVLAGAEPDRRLGLDEPPYVGCPAGGIVVMPKATALDIPLDPRFVGWGGEDRSWGWALRILLGGAWRGDAALWHLWHPPQPRETRNRGNAANDALRARYDAIRYDAAAMRALLEEVTP